MPEVLSFKPCGIPRHKLEMIALTVDEMEAIRLADWEGLYQEKAAERMKVSRQTFGNIISEAHKKVADFLIHSKNLVIEGGHVQMKTSKCCDIHSADGLRGKGRGAGFGKGYCCGRGNK